MPAKGYILQLSDERLDVMAEAGRDLFAEPVPEFEHSRRDALLCIVINQAGIVRYVGDGKRGVRAGTGLSRINVRNFTEVEEEPNLYSLIEQAPLNYHNRLKRYVQPLRLVPTATLQLLSDLLARSAPSIRGILSRFGNQRREFLSSIPPQVESNLAQQKEALSTALSIADISRDELLLWQAPQPGDIPRSFLDGLETARLREDQMIFNDLRRIPSFELLEQNIVGAAMFQNRFTRVITLLANRLPLEEALGADLIYYNERLKSFVFVQYKAMENRNGAHEFRLPDVQLARELQRMESTLGVLSGLADEGTHDDFRFLANPFFIKFCPRLVLDPDSARLTNGFYLPLPLFQRLLNSDALNGPRGGRRISYESVSRYLTNAEFVRFVAKSWVGTHQRQSETLTTYIREVLASGKALLFAVAEEMPYDKFTDEFLETETEKIGEMEVGEPGV